MNRLIIAILLTAVVSSGITAIVVHTTDGAAVVNELRREDRDRKSGQDEAERWMSDPGKPLGQK